MTFTLETKTSFYSATKLKNEDKPNTIGIIPFVLNEDKSNHLNMSLGLESLNLLKILRENNIPTDDKLFDKYNVQLYSQESSLEELVLSIVFFSQAFISKSPVLSSVVINITSNYIYDLIKKRNSKSVKVKIELQFEEVEGNITSLKYDGNCFQQFEFKKKADEIIIRINGKNNDTN
ncbi:MAG: hypothetical protein QM523_10495 [Candidatus Pacebacteria bacterium]|nr:hypothetical protein [Candidatus Paceibacterota bacterium]